MTRGHRRVALVLVLACAAAACGHRPVEPPSLRDVMTRELDALPVLDGVASDGALSLRAEAAAPLHVTPDADGAYTVEIPLGIPAAVSCWISPKPFDPATILQKAVHEAAPAGRVMLIDAGVLGDRAALYVEIAVPVGPPEAGDWGLLKVAVAALEPGIALCSHPAGGYRQSFRRMLGTLMPSIRFPLQPPVPPPTYREVHVLVSNGIRHGTWTVRFYVRPDGTRLTEGSGSMVVPTPAEGFNLLQGRSEYYLEHSDAFGTVTSLQQGLAGSGERRSDWTATRDGEHVFHLQGTLDGESVDDHIRIVSAMLDMHAAAKRLREALADTAAGPLTTTLVAPALDRHEARRVVWRRTGPSGPEGTPVERRGASALPECLLIDEHGRATRRWTCQQPEWLMERVVEQGSL